MRKIASLFFGLLVANISTHEAEAKAAPAAEQKMARVTITSIGQGNPVVLIPGLASPRAVWDGIAPELAKGHRVIMVQVNGFGGGDAGVNGQPGLLDGVVQDVSAHLAKENIRDAAVIGHSMGGLLAMMLAKKEPGRVAKLMIVDALPFYGALMGPGATPDSVRPIAEQMRRMIVSGPAPSQAPPNMSNSSAGQAKVLAWLKASDRASVGQAMTEVATKDFTPDLPKLTATPVTVLYAVPSAERAGLTKGLYTSAYAALPSAKLIPVEGSAHFIMLDQPEVFAEKVAAFLK